MTTRQQRIKRVYMDGSGNTSGYPTEGVEAIRHDHLDDEGNVIGSVSVELPSLDKTMIVRLAAHGWNNRVGNAGNSSAGSDPVEGANSLAEQILAGEWGSERAPGLAPSIYFEALELAMQVAGRDFDVEAHREKLADMDEGDRKVFVAGIQKGAAVALQIENVKQARAKVRKAKLVQAVKTAGPGELDAI